MYVQNTFSHLNNLFEQINTEKKTKRKKMMMMRMMSDRLILLLLLLLFVSLLFLVVGSTLRYQRRHLRYLQQKEDQGIQFSS